MNNPGAQANVSIEKKVSDNRVTELRRSSTNSHMDRLMSVREFLDRTRYAGYLPQEEVSSNLNLRHRFCLQTLTKLNTLVQFTS